MTYIIVKDRQTVVGAPFASFTAALHKANALFGDDVEAWLGMLAEVHVPGALVGETAHAVMVFNDVLCGISQRTACDQILENLVLGALDVHLDQVNLTTLEI